MTGSGSGPLLIALGLGCIVVPVEVMFAAWKVGKGRADYPAGCFLLFVVPLLIVGVVFVIEGIRRWAG